MKKNTLSVIIPTLNEAGNINNLVKRIDKTLVKANITYELLFIDDNSTDETRQIIKTLKKKYPITLFIKSGNPGKAQSLIEGFSYAKYQNICMIDADLQYPPEKISQMVKKLDKGFDIVVANRVIQKTSIMRQLASRTFTFIFARILHGLKCDVQSGLKVFKLKAYTSISVNPSPWTFDLEFLIRAQNSGFIITTVPITLSGRVDGKTKVKFVKAAYEIGSSAIILRLTLIWEYLKMSRGRNIKDYKYQSN